MAVILQQKSVQKNTFITLNSSNMNQEKYNLNWHTYSDHLKEMLHEMMKSNELTDVTLVCDDKRQFKAHKIVLSACSSVFKSIINDLPHDLIYSLPDHFNTPAEQRQSAVEQCQ